MPARTKIEISPALVRNTSGLDDVARIFFPDNRNHRRAFVALWLAIKYSEHRFLPSLCGLAQNHGLSRRALEIVRAKLKRLGLIKRISQFNPAFGYRAGWTFSPRFRQAISSLAGILDRATTPSGSPVDERKDRDAFMYV